MFSMAQWQCLYCLLGVRGYLTLPGDLPRQYEHVHNQDQIWRLKFLSQGKSDPTWEVKIGCSNTWVIMKPLYTSSFFLHFPGRQGCDRQVLRWGGLKCVSPRTLAFCKVCFVYSQVQVIIILAKLFWTEDYWSL